MATVTFTWAPNPAQLGASMEAVAAALETRLVPMKAASEAMQADIQERFTTETDPSGAPWKPLSFKYIMSGWNKTHPPPYTTRRRTGTTLKDTGKLMEAATSSRAEIVTNNAVFYRTSGLPSYGLAHEFGLPGRASGELPQRSFLGMSDASAALVLGLFAEWFDGSIMLYPTSTGKIAPRHAIRGGGPGGTQFVSRSSVGKGPIPRV
jgi:phage gpG-like protein